MKTSIALAALVAMFPQVRLVVQARPASPQDTQNAALKYLRAEASLRQSYALPTDAAATLQKALESPLDGEDEQLVASADEALREFHHGAFSKRCDWEMRAEDGALASTAHRGAIMELAYVSGLRARLRFRDGNSVGAASDLITGITAARHLSVDGSLASVLFAYKLENALSGVLAQNLFRFSPAELKELQNNIGSLPSGFSLGIAFVAEKVHRNDFSNIAREAKSRDDVISMLLKQVPILESNRASATEIVDGCGGSLKGFQSCVRQQESFYAEWATRFSLSPEEFEREYNTQIEKLSKDNPVLRQFTPALPRFRWAEAYCQTRRALLRAAIEVRPNGPNTVDRYTDPYDSKQFSYVQDDNGFRLESRLRERGVPLSLSIVTR